MRRLDSKGGRKIGARYKKLFLTICRIDAPDLWDRERRDRRARRAMRGFRRSDRGADKGEYLTVRTPGKALRQRLAQRAFVCDALKGKSLCSRRLLRGQAARYSPQ